MNNVYCEICKIHFHKNSVWKRNKSATHINNLRYEQIDSYDDIVQIPEWLFREKRVRKFVNPFHLKKPLSDQYNVILIQHSPIDLNSELKLVGKYNQYNNQVHINNIVKQMNIKDGELIKHFKFKIKVYVNVKYEKYPEDEATEVISHHIPIDVIDNLTRIQLNDLDVMNSLDNEIQKREMEGSGWNIQGINYLKISFHKTNALNGMTYVKFSIRITQS